MVCVWWSKSFRLKVSAFPQPTFNGFGPTTSDSARVVFPELLGPQSTRVVHLLEPLQPSAKLG